MSPYLQDDIGPAFDSLRNAADTLLKVDPVRLVGDTMTIASGIVALTLVLHRIEDVRAAHAAE
jgi:hypothetical protein